MQRHSGASVGYVEGGWLGLRRFGAPQFRQLSLDAKCGIDYGGVIAAVVDEVEIAIDQFAVNEFHVGIVVLFRIIEVRLQVERIENVRQVQTGVNSTSAYLVNTAAVTEQL